MAFTFPWYRSHRYTATLARCCALLGLLLLPARAQAGDGLYERLDGDLVLSAGLGGGLSTRGSEPLGVAELDALYLDSAGLLLRAEQVDGVTGLAWGAQLRPLFLARFFLGAWSGRNRLDLLIDSLAFELGSWFGPLAEGPGSALWLGTSAELPLSASRRGFHLRLAARYVHARPEMLGAPSPFPGGLRISAALVYAGILDTGLTASGPARP